MIDEKTAIRLFLEQCETVPATVTELAMQRLLKIVDNAQRLNAMRLEYMALEVFKEYSRTYR